MAEETKISVRLVPSGLWEGARLIAPDGRKAIYHSNGYVGNALYYGNDHVTDGMHGVVTPNWHLDFGDLLGLGLAGLLGRVAQFYGVNLHPVERTIDSVLDEVRWLDAWPIAVPMSGFTSITQLRMLATYAALAPRLCALAGLELERREIPKWEAVDALEGTWLLSTSAGSCQFFKLSGSIHAAHVWAETLSDALDKMERAAFKG